MTTYKSLRKRYWLFVLGWVSLVYSTLYIVRPICDFLKATTPFSFLINVLCSAFLFSIIMRLWMKICIRRWSSYLIVILVVLAYVYGLVTLQLSSEKIHFIEYGFLAYLVIKAISLDIKKPIAYGFAFLLVTIIGWVDEGIQNILPNRYYSIDDVILNSISGALVLLLVFVFKEEQKMYT